MTIRTEKVMELMETHCGGNYTQFAKELGVPVAQLHRALKCGLGSGVLDAVVEFCRGKGIDEREFV